MIKRISKVLVAILMLGTLSACTKEEAAVKNKDKTDGATVENKDKIEAATKEETAVKQEPVNPAAEVQPTKEETKDDEEPVKIEPGKHRFTKLEDLWIEIEGKKFIAGEELSIPEGWNSKYEGTKAPAKGKRTGIFSKTGYGDLYLSFYNDSDKEKPVADCEITYISIHSYTGSIKNIDFKLPAGINLSSTFEDVVKAYGTPSDGNKYRCEYTVGGKSGIRFEFSTSDSEIVAIDFIKR